MPAITFQSYRDPTVSVTLADHADLPKSDLIFGARMRRAVTRYGGRNQTSVQYLGDEYAPIPIEGVWSDRQSGVMGRAGQLARAFEALQAQGGLIEVQWGSYVRWGIMDFSATFKRQDYVMFRMDFEVLFVEPPAFLRVQTFATPPVDQASAASSQAAALRAHVDDPPAGLSSDLLTESLLFVAAVENDISSALQVLESAGTAAELASDIARRATSSLVAPLIAVGRMRARTKAATLDTIATVQGVEAVIVRRWSDELDRLSLELRATLAELIRNMVETDRPTSGREYVVRSGETLQRIAFREYGDHTLWTRIADASGLDSPRVIPGQTLTIPEARP